jgi:hypothetical protein
MTLLAFAKAVVVVTVAVGAVIAVALGAMTWLLNHPRD